MTLDDLNGLPESEAREAFERCCGARRWVDEMVQGRPFESPAALREAGDLHFATLGREDWLEAFAHHPRIGDLSSLKARFANTQAWASGEQSGTASASEAILEALAKGNADYEARFGYIFIVCATGKSASEMLEALNQRLPNGPEAELAIAAREQQRITHLRLEKLLA